ncbi:hypothetical protein J6590_050124 [Homalodisca vitripennis]|nr:hypothetical protein J6590_050124 [Homalodisca vitripennis]
MALVVANCVLSVVDGVFATQYVLWYFADGTAVRHLALTQSQLFCWKLSQSSQESSQCRLEYRQLRKVDTEVILLRSRTPHTTNLRLSRCFVTFALHIPAKIRQTQSRERGLVGRIIRSQLLQGWVTLEDLRVL